VSADSFNSISNDDDDDDDDDYYYYYCAAFNAPCVGRKDDESQCMYM